jgi:hypothetical protein
MMTVVGSCPKCGAPVYGPAAWMGITPPPSTPSCACSTGVIRTTITSEPRTLPDNIWRDFGKELDALKAENALLRQQLDEIRNSLNT